MSGAIMETAGWTPHPKIVAAAIAAVIVWAAREFAGIDVPSGVEAAVAVIVAYLVPAAGSSDDE